MIRDSGAPDQNYKPSETVVDSNGGTFAATGNPETGAQYVEVLSGFALPEYDYVTVSYPTDTQEVYVFKIGGSSGVTVATITVDYTDSSKASISTVAKT